MAAHVATHGATCMLTGRHIGDGRKEAWGGGSSPETSPAARGRVGAGRDRIAGHLQVMAHLVGWFSSTGNDRGWPRGSPEMGEVAVLHGGCTGVLISLDFCLVRVRTCLKKVWVTSYGLGRPWWWATTTSGGEWRRSMRAGLRRKMDQIEV
jgi:hypothetical protein